MFATRTIHRSSPFSSPGSDGQGRCTSNSPLPMMQLQTQLQQLKSAPVLNPHYGMVMT